MHKRTRPTIVDVARIAGVSTTTVSYVLSGSRSRTNRISEATRGRVLDAVEEVGYVANISARNLRLRRTDHVLFLGSRITSLYSQIIARTIETEIIRHDLVLNVQIGSGVDHVKRAIESLDQHLVDGLIVETDDESTPWLRDAASRGHAIVAIGPSTAEETFDVMSNDDGPAIEDAMRHAVERGYRHFVLMSMRQSDPCEHRIDVAQRTLLAEGVRERDITVTYCPHDRTEAYRAAMAFLPQVPHPVAIYAGADLSAIGVLWACQRQGFAVGDDVAIIGHGNTPETHISVPRLTSLGPIDIDYTEAARLMVTRLAQPALPGRHVSVPCQLYIRESG